MREKGVEGGEQREGKKSEEEHCRCQRFAAALHFRSVVRGILQFNALRRRSGRDGVRCAGSRADQESTPCLSIRGVDEVVAETE